MKELEHCVHKISYFMDMNNCLGAGSNDIEHGEGYEGASTDDMEKKVGHNMFLGIAVLTSGVGCRKPQQLSRWRSWQQATGRVQRNDNRNQSPGETGRG
jgi:hypothetical protein